MNAKPPPPVPLELAYVVEQLAGLYEPNEARQWLLSRQKVLNGERPAELIQQGRSEEVMQAIKQLLEGVDV